MTRGLSLVAALLLGSWNGADAGPPAAGNTFDTRGTHDGGSVPPGLSPEDLEVVQNLELLQHYDETQSLDLLLELSRDE